MAQCLPERTCVACRGKAPAQTLIRFVAADAEKPELRLDEDDTLPGRGAWLHRQVECFDVALARKAFPRALRVDHLVIDADLLRATVAKLDPKNDQS